LELSVKGSASEDGHRSVAADGQGQYTKNSRQDRTAKQTHEHPARLEDRHNDTGTGSEQLGEAAFDRFVDQV
jgi:hypothetical protein